jgi:hypothetical protein
MATGLKEMFNPDVGKKIVNVLENQAPLLLTSLFTNLYSTLSIPVRPSSSTINLTGSSGLMNNNASRRLRNGSTPEIINDVRNLPAK